MKKGNVNKAFKLISNHKEDWILLLNNKTLSSLKKKHP